MIAVLRTIALRLGSCALATWLAWRYGSATAALLTASLLGLALPRPLIDLASELRHQYRRAHWRDVEGRHYAFHGMPLAVHEDAEHRRWVRVADMRAIVGHTASDASLALTYPNGWRLIGHPPEPYLSDDALDAHLAKERSVATARFRHWAEREIGFPARRQRERYGIHLEALDFRASADPR
ncbi:MAG: hypothetical protein ABI809_03550 [Caldimonas sp.]